MTLYKSPPITINRVTSNIAKVLDEREKKWVEEHCVMTKERLQKLCDAALKAEEYTHVLLHKCKTWGGQFTSIDELEQCVLTTDDASLKTILRTEVSYRRHTSPQDFQARSTLYKLNHLTVAEFKINFALILTNETENIQSIPDMPGEEDMIKVFNLQDNTDNDCENTVVTPQSEIIPVYPTEVAINEPCIVLWDINNQRQWYMGICLNDNDDGTYRVEHLERCNPTADGKMWRYPKQSDIQSVDIIQIMPCNIIGSWDLSKRIMIFVLENCEMIDVLFKSFLLITGNNNIWQ